MKISLAEKKKIINLYEQKEQINLPRLINPLISRLWEVFSRLAGP